MEKDTAVLDASNTGSSLPQGLESAIKTNHFALSPGYRFKDFANAVSIVLLLCSIDGAAVVTQSKAGKEERNQQLILTFRSI